VVPRIAPPTPAPRVGHVRGHTSGAARQLPAHGAESALSRAPRRAQLPLLRRRRDGTRRRARRREVMTSSCHAIMPSHHHVITPSCHHTIAPSCHRWQGALPQPLDRDARLPARARERRRDGRAASAGELWQGQRRRHRETRAAPAFTHSLPRLPAPVELVHTDSHHSRCEAGRGAVAARRRRGCESAARVQGTPQCSTTRGAASRCRRGPRGPGSSRCPPLTPSASSRAPAHPRPQRSATAHYLVL
jgi:hypothetical protein